MAEVKEGDLEIALDRGIETSPGPRQADSTGVVIPEEVAAHAAAGRPVPPANGQVKAEAGLVDKVAVPGTTRAPTALQHTPMWGQWSEHAVL